MCVSVHKSRKGVSDAIELKLQAAVNRLLGTELGSSRRAVSALTC